MHHRPAITDPRAANALFAELSDRFIGESLALVPSNASQAGYHKHPDPLTGKMVELDAVLDDFSPEGFEFQCNFYTAWQTTFHKEVPVKLLGPQESADWHLLDDTISLQLLEYGQIQNARHNPTVVVEAIGNALFLPITQEYAPKEVRLGHVMQRVEQVPRAIHQAKQLLLDSDPIFIKVAVEENEGNIDLIENTIKNEITPGSKQAKDYEPIAKDAVAALNDFNHWLQTDLAARKTDRSWRLGAKWYAEKFKYYLETSTTPQQMLAAAEAELKKQRAEMLALALPLHAQWFPKHGAHNDLKGEARENVIIGEVLHRISDDHAQRDHLMDAVNQDLEGIKAFIREKKIVDLGSRDNLKVIPTPPFMRGIYSVAGFHSAPPLEPTAEAQYWVTPIDPKMPDQRAESKLREYNSFVLKWLTIHEALPGHYVQAEHANNIEPTRRRLLRNLFGNNAYVEGWAEYIADVMVDAGYLNKDPRWLLSRKKIWLRAIANTILDVRLQTMNMTDQEALDLMTQRCFQTQAEADGKLQRAKLSSVQLPTYFSGSQAWWSFRKRYQAAMGKKFDMYSFHNQALDLGPLPLSSIEKLMMPGEKTNKEAKSAPKKKE